MGLDLTLLPHKHHHVSGEPLLCESLRLDRDSRLFQLIGAAPSHEAGPVVVHTDSGWGTRTTNPYGEPVRYVLAGELGAAFVARLPTSFSPWNIAVGEFLRALPADVPVYLWWH